MSRPTYLTINLAALTHNISRVRVLAPGCSIIGMVKANAYGHGIERVAPALSSLDALGVASLEEGIRLREAGVTMPIVLMEGVFYADELKEAAYHRFTLVVHHVLHIEMLEKFAASSTTASFHIWLKVDTGMHRLGIPPAALHTAYQRLSAISCVHHPIGLMTHLADADQPDSGTTAKQIALFEAVTATLPGPRSIANSAAILAWPCSHDDWVRPGLMLYGASPFANQLGRDHGLLPVMSLTSQLIAITSVEKGDTVGYGGTWTAPEAMRIGVVGVGYGDGYPQSAQNQTPVLVNQKICPLVGRVSMDMLTVDLRLQPAAQIGDPVVLWGDNLPVEQVARHSHTSAYEILTRMTPRPKMQVVK